MATQTILFALPETGLALTAQAATVAGVSFALDVAVTEIGEGLYSLPLTDSAGKYRLSLTDDDDFDALLAVFYVTTTNTAATFDAVSERVLLEISEDAAAAAAGGGGGGGGDVTGLSAAAIAQLAGTTIRLASTEQTDNRHLEIVRGCDYAAADGTALTWTITDAQDLTAATATLTLKKGATTQAFTGTVTETAADTWQISIELTAAQTDALTASLTDWTYSLTLTLANDHVRSLRKPGHFVRVLSPS